MVKGISRQVIVVKPMEPKLFEQAIFILNDSAAKSGVTDEILLKEAEQAIRGDEHPRRKRKLIGYGAFWAGIGAAATGVCWLISLLF